MPVLTGAQEKTDETHYTIRFGFQKSARAAWPVPQDL